MDVAHPIRAVVPSLDGPVLEVLAGTTRPLTTLEIHRLAAVGSSTGVRKVLERLAEQGIASADHRGNAIYYVANRDHLAWPAVETLAGLRRELRRRLADFIGRWPIPPLHASLFGSAARADGDATSDIDVLVVEPGLRPGKQERWEEQIDGLRAHVRAMTGNRCQVFVVTAERLDEHVARGDPLVGAWLPRRSSPRGPGASGAHLVAPPEGEQMTRAAGKTSPCDAGAARARLQQAQAFVSVAEAVFAEPDDEEPPLRGVAAALAVLAGIAASDAACCARLGKRHRGQDHARAIELLRTVRPDGEALAKDLERLLAIKDNVHYGAIIISLPDAKAAVKRARRMIDLVTSALV